jgi:putative membrane protein
MAEFRIGYLINALIFTVAGLLVFAAAMATVDRFIPQRIWKGVVEEKNIALAVLVGAAAIAIGLIISSAMH